MKILRIGLVVEGKTDHIVIKALFQHRISTLRPHAQVRFIEIQPCLDETGASTPGGWTHVYAWCMRNSPEARESLYLGRPLFANTADANRCDVLVVALDSDASAEIASKFSLAPPPPPPSPVERGEFIRSTIVTWLWPNGGEVQDRHVPVAAVEAIETWLIAAFHETTHPEHIAAVDETFINVCYDALGKAIPPGVKQVGKTPPNYEKISNVAANHSAKVTAACSNFDAAIRGILDNLDKIYPSVAT